MRMVNNTYKILQRIATRTSFWSLLLVVMFTNTAKAQDCPLACNNLVQVSLDFQCEATITPDIILEGHDDASLCDYYIVLFDENDIEIGRTTTVGNDLIHPIVGSDYIGRTVGVEIYVESSALTCFDENFDDLLWSSNLDVLLSSATDGSITFADDCDITLTASSDGTGVTYDEICIDIYQDGTLSFDWSAITEFGGLPSGSFNDDTPSYTINGDVTDLATTGNTDSGSVVDLNLVEGNTFCFRVASNNTDEVVSLAISNFSFNPIYSGEQVNIETANSCWAAVVIEDKVPTQIVCPPDFTLLCIEDLTQAMLLNESGTTTYESESDLAEIILPSTATDFSVSAVNGAYGFELITGVSVCPTLSSGSLSDLAITITDPAGSIVGTTTGPLFNCFNTSDFNLTVANDAFVSGDWVVNITNTGAVNAVVESVDFSVSVQSALATSYDGDNCNNTTISITGDDFLEYDCRPDDSDYTMQRLITWEAVDGSGNTTSCSFVISYEKGDLADVVMPDNVVIDASQDDVISGVFDCGLDYVNLADTTFTSELLPGENTLAGVPTIGGLPIFPMNIDNVCKFNVSYEDTFIQDCGANFKIIRTYYIYDWCNAEVVEFTQTISSKDKVAPVVSTQYDEITTSVTPSNYSCSADFKLDFFSETSYDVIDLGGDITKTTGLGGFLTDCSGKVILDVGFKEANPDGSEPDDSTPFIYSGDTDKVMPMGDGVFQFFDMEGPRVWIKFLVADECGNSTYFPTYNGLEEASITVEVDIIDNTPPVAVCDEFTGVTINENGWGRVYAESLDDGSYDYCDDELTYEVRRPNADACSEFSETNDQQFGEFVQFCCDDRGQDIEVELRVTDSNNNSSICTVIVRPQIFGESYTTTCPSVTNYDMTCEAYANLTNLDNYNTEAPVVTYEGPCSGTFEPYSKDDTSALVACGDFETGTIRRNWFILQDNAEIQLVGCTQFIEVTNVIDLSACTDPDDAACNIVWPSDRLNETGCIETDADPDGYNDYPKYKGTNVSIEDAPGCRMLAYTYTDQVFSDVEDACFKIVRTWTVIDWCLYSTTDQNPQGIYTNTQVIKLDNNDSPIFTSSTASFGSQGDEDYQSGGSGIEFCTPANTCSMAIALSTAAKDACTDNPITGSSRYTYTLTNISSGVQVASDSGTSVTRTLGAGSYRITWTVIGACDITSTDVFNFTVNDCTAPVPYCKGGITTAILPGAFSVEIWASDLDLNSTDECTAEEDLVFTFANGDSNMTFTCDDLGENTVTIYIEDESGNRDFCTTTVTIQANNGACNSAGRVMIAGTVGTENSQAIDEVSVALEHMADNTMAYQSTLVDGYYAFEDLLSLEDYHLTADYDDDPRNGISTLDLVLIQRHILNLETLDSPYKIIAADANGSESITAADMVDIRKLILHVHDVYPNNKSWRFVDANKQYADVTHPWPIAEDILIADMLEDQMSVNWVGVKVGDVNGSVTINGHTTEAVDSRDKQSLDLEVKEVEAGIYQVIAKSDVTLTGAQFQLYVDGIKTISRGELDFNQNMVVIDDNSFALSYDNINGVALSEGSVLFTIQATADMTPQLGDLIRAEAYDTNFEILDINIENVKVGSEFALYQNVPNPFATSTSIGFSIPKAGFATLEVMDINGRILYSLNKGFEQGLNTATIDASMLPAAGVVYYRLHFDGNMETRKMILLD